LICRSPRVLLAIAWSGLPALNAFTRTLRSCYPAAGCTSPSRRALAFLTRAHAPTRPRRRGALRRRTLTRWARRALRGAGAALRRALCLAQRPARPSRVGDCRRNPLMTGPSAVGHPVHPCCCAGGVVATHRSLARCVLALALQCLLRSSGPLVIAGLFSRTGASRFLHDLVDQQTLTTTVGIFGDPRAGVRRPFIFLFRRVWQL